MDDYNEFIEEEIEPTSVEIEPEKVQRLTDAEIDSRYQAHLDKIRGGK